MTFPNTFATQTGAIPTSKLDENFGALLDTSAATKGAALVAYDGTLNYAASTAGGKLNRLPTAMDRGAAGNGTGNDQPSIQAIIDALSAAGGGKLRAGGRTYRLTAPLIIKDGVDLDMEGGKLLFALSGAADYGVRLRSRAHIRNFIIEVQSSGSPNAGAGFHSPIVIGPFYGDGGTVASPSVDEGVSRWGIHNGKLWTSGVGKVGIQIIGGANNGVIEDVEIPDNSAMAGGIHLDWGYVGTIISANITTSRANFDAGTAYTTHPNTIHIRNIKMGALSRAKTGLDTGSHGVRISGCHNIRVNNVTIKQTTYAAVRIHAGDVGYEFAPAALKPLRMKGIVVDGVLVENTTDSWAIYADTFADNVASAISGGYSARLDPVHDSDLQISHVTAKGSGGASVTPGLLVIQCRGGSFTDLDLEGYSNGVTVDEKVYGVKIHGSFHGNRGHGIYIEHGTTPPEDVQVLPGTQCFQNGADAGFANPTGICIGQSKRTRVDGALLGHRTAASETTQSFGLRVTSSAATDVQVTGCNVFSVKSGGTAYSLLSSTAYGVITLWANNIVDSAVTNKMAGLNILPISRTVSPDGVTRGVYVAARAALSADTTPTAGTWVAGDVIYHTNPTGSNTGTRCTAGGSPGTWGTF